MSSLNETPCANRVRISFFGLRNAGKSTLVNAFAGQEVALVSPVAGTTTDPVSKAMEILPLGPCLLTDTAGLDDIGALGEERVRRTLEVLAVTDIAVWVSAGGDEDHPLLRGLSSDCAARNVPLVVYRRGDGVESLKSRLASMRLEQAEISLLDGLLPEGGTVVCVCPIDSSAPKGRLILPQVQVLREALDRHGICLVCQPSELTRTLEAAGNSPLVVTDSQAFGEVKKLVAGRDVRLTSFSILFARQKGDLSEYLRGLDALQSLAEGDCVLVAEGCTHHRQCGDIGSVKIPKALEKLTGKKFSFTFASGSSFDLSAGEQGPVRLAVQCGGCMLTRREALRRIGLCRAAGVPVVNYGLLLAAANGLSGVRADGLVPVLAE